MNPLVPVSWGELIDKITILEIRQEPLLTPAARANATHELPPLRAVAAELGEAPSGLASLRERAGRRRLKRAINELLGPDIIEEKQYADYRNGA